MRAIPQTANPSTSKKFIKKWMKEARYIALDNDTPCTRKVGCIITDTDGIILGTGYNGAPRKTPHCDSTDYIRDILWPKLDELEKDKLCSVALDKLCSVALKQAKENPKLFKELFDCDIKDLEHLIEIKHPLIKNSVSNILGGCKTCPRRFFGYGSGIRNDLCSCQHAETNAITNANGSVKGGILFGYCCTSCQNCTGAIINARIKEVHFLDGPEYQVGCLKLYECANIPVFLHSEEEFD